MRLRIREWRKRRGYTLEDLAGRADDMSVGYLSQLERGVRRINSRMLQQIAEALDVTASDLILSEHKARLVGRVGAGSEVFPIDDHPLYGDLPEVPMPPDMDPNETVAVEVTGDSMEPTIGNGWLLYYTKMHEGVTQDELNHLCVVRREDGAMFVKKVIRGADLGTFTLLSSNAPPLMEQRLEWAARVLAFMPPPVPAEEVAA
jgi:transcriptional regulator with XRE-family HTH domain